MSLSCLPCDRTELISTVREPLPSKINATQLTFAASGRHHLLTIRSHMTQNGVIFGDGIESNYLWFDAGATARASEHGTMADISRGQRHSTTEVKNEQPN